MLLLLPVEIWVLALHLEAATSGLDNFYLRHPGLPLLLGLADDLSPLGRILDDTGRAVFLDLELALFDKSLDLSIHRTSFLKLF